MNRMAGGGSGAHSAAARRAALQAYARSAFASGNRCEAFVNVVEKAVSLVDGADAPAATLLEDLKLVLIGEGLTSRTTGPYFAGNFRGSSGFKPELRDESPQSAHAMAGVYIGHTYGATGVWAAAFVGEIVLGGDPIEWHDVRLYAATGPLGTNLTDENYRELPARLRAGICEYTGQLPATGN